MNIVPQPGNELAALFTCAAMATGRLAARRADEVRAIHLHLPRFSARSAYDLQRDQCERQSAQHDQHLMPGARSEATSFNRRMLPLEMASLCQLLRHRIALIRLPSPAEFTTRS